MLEFKAVDPFSGLVHFAAKDWQKLVGLMNDLNLKETPAFRLTDRHGNTAMYFREDVQRWISVDVYLPPTPYAEPVEVDFGTFTVDHYSDEVWVYDKKEGSTNAIFYKESNGKEIFCDLQGGMFQHVTHWMPKPSPPGEVK
jgi:hypothetical protein